jgi:hypothetical protein
MSKYWKTVMTVEVLSEGEEAPEFPGGLEEVVYDIDRWSMSGVAKCPVSEELTPTQMAKALIEQGSDPQFLGPDRDGNEIGYV